MKTIAEIEIRPFQPENQEDAKNLILAGLGEHWGFIDLTKNPDLDNITATYKDDTFLAVWKDRELIGTGALIQRTNEIAEIVRMSVRRDFRRQGIGRRLLEGLIGKARTLGCHQIILETTETWKDVIAFYLGFGFRITHFQDGDVYFILNLER